MSSLLIEDRPVIGLTPKQLDTVRDSTAMFNLWEGAVSSGKTVGSLFRWVLFVEMTMSLPGQLLMCGRTRDSVWRNAILPLMDLMPGVVKGNLGAPTCRVLNRTVHVMGAADVRSEEPLRGLTLLGAYVDELTTLPESFFKMLMSRLRVRKSSGAPASKLFATTNPDSPQHWLMKDFLKKLDTDEKIGKAWRRFHFTIDDNPTLSASYVETMKSQYSGLWYKRFILGEWVLAEGAVFQSWDQDHMVVDEIPPLDDLIACGIDYGTTNPTRGALVGRAGDRLYVVDEWAPPIQQSDPALTASFRNWLQAGGYAPRWIPTDPSAASFRRLLHDEGQPGVTAASNNVLNGIRVVDALFAADRLRIHRRCTHLIDGINGYVWDPKQTEKGKDAPLKVADHEVDALRYALYSTRSEWTYHLPLSLPPAVEEDI